MRGKCKLIAGVAALALAAGVGTASAGSRPYVVHLTVPSTVVKGSQFAIVAHGVSSNAARLTVFVAHNSCALTAKKEALTGTLIIHKHVVNSFSYSYAHVATKVGTHRACAYLTAVLPYSITYARASKSWTVTP
jgi:hypothetical protein